MRIEPKKQRNKDLILIRHPMPIRLFSIHLIHLDKIVPVPKSLQIPSSETPDNATRTRSVTSGTDTTE